MSCSASPRRIQKKNGKEREMEIEKRHSTVYTLPNGYGWDDYGDLKIRRDRLIF